MRAKSLDRIVLTGHHRRHLIRLARAGTTPQRLAMRTRIVLHAAAGADNAVIAARIGICVDTVRKWRHRWTISSDVGSLDDAKRVGRPPIFSPVQLAQIKAAACQPPDDHNVALAKWSCLDPMPGS